MTARESLRFLKEEVLKPFPESSLWNDYAGVYEEEGATYTDPQSDFADEYDRAVAIVKALVNRVALQRFEDLFTAVSEYMIEGEPLEKSPALEDLREAHEEAGHTIRQLRGVN